jgi:hypothetical protein
MGREMATTRSSIKALRTVAGYTLRTAIDRAWSCRCGFTH